MRIAISDANILIDISSVGLLETMTRLPFEFVVPDFVVNEITRPEQKEAIDSLVRSGVLKVIAANTEELESIGSLARAVRTLSIPDCSVLILAGIHGAMILSNDSRMRQHAKSTGLECHGTIWIVHQLVVRRELGTDTARNCLLRLMSTNVRFPKSESSDLIRELERRKE
jgi:predicted nucleic acid-binding protein